MRVVGGDNVERLFRSIATNSCNQSQTERSDHTSVAVILGKPRMSPLFKSVEVELVDIASGKKVDYIFDKDGSPTFYLLF